MNLAPELCLLLALLVVPTASGLMMQPGDRAASWHSGTGFSHMEVYSINGQEHLIIGQTNGLLRLSSNLKNSSFTRIGPLNDSDTCMPHQSLKNIAYCNVKPIDNHVRAMQVKGERLYFCMSFLSGSCHAAQLTSSHSNMTVDVTDVATKLTDAFRGLLCRRPESSIQLTVAPRNQRDDSASVPDGLYLSMPFCASETIHPTLSVVDLRTSKQFTMTSAGGLVLSRFEAEVLPRAKKVRPGTLTHHLSFSRTSSSPGNCSCVYFVLTAADPPSQTRELPYHEDKMRMRVGRLCSADLYLARYAEVFLECKSPEYTAVAATVARPGKLLGAALNVTPDDADSPSAVLFLAVAVRNTPVGGGSGGGGGGGGGGGVCAFPLAEVDRQLDNVLTDCRQGRPLARYGPSYLAEERKCPVTGGSEPSCSQPSERTPAHWEGTFSRDSSRICRGEFLTETSDNVTAISVAAVQFGGGDTLIYLGTSGGHLLGYRSGEKGKTQAFSRLSLRRASGDPALPVLAVRTGSDRLYTLTETQVSSQPYANCEQDHNTCAACLAVNNPHCVWSNLPGSDGGCRTWPHNRRIDTGFLTDASNCLNVTEVIDSDVCIDSPSGDGKHSVTLVVENVPDADTPMYCLQIDDTGSPRPSASTAVAVVSRNDAARIVLTCSLDWNDLQVYLGTLVSRSFKLLLSTSRQAADPQLAVVPAQVFSCRRRASCGECAADTAQSAVSQCGWCSSESACVRRQAFGGGTSGCDGSSLVTDRNSCPVVRLLDASLFDNAIIAPSGVASEQRLVYGVSGLQPYMRHFYCTVSCPDSEASMVQLPAEVKVNDRTLTCQIPEHSPLNYQSMTAANVTCQVVFHWSQVSESSSTKPRRHPLDAEAGASRLVLFKCQAIGSEGCDVCVLRTPARYGCIWCGGSCLSATAAASCPAGQVTLHGGLCAHPRLESVHPAKLAPLPNLTVTATGWNLGNRADSLAVRLVPISSGVGFENLDCHLLPSTYKPGRRFQCRVFDAPSLAAFAYRLEVRVLGIQSSSQDAAIATSQSLPVRNPILTALSTGSVQQRGGAEIRLTGAYLDAGSDLRVTWRRFQNSSNGLTNDSLELSAEIIERRSDSLKLKLSNFTATGMYNPVLKVQGQTVTGISSSSATEVIALRVAQDAKPLVTDSDLRTGLLPIGGLDFVITGLGLEAVQHAILRFVEFRAPSNTSTALLMLDSPCRLIRSSDTRDSKKHNSLACPSPAIAERQRRSIESVSRDQMHRQFSAIIILDSLEHPYPAPVLTLQPNPSFNRLPPQLTIPLSDSPAPGTHIRRDLRLVGRGLCPAVLTSDIRVTVGSTECRLANLSSRNQCVVAEVVTCRFLLSAEVIGRALSVTVSIGQLTFDLGHVTYTTEFPWIFVYVGLGVGSVLLFAACLAGCIHAHQKSRRRRDKANGIEVHLNNLEAKVSKNCRDAFAELQLNSCPEVVASDPAASARPPVRSFTQFAAYACFAERYRDRHRANDCIFADVATEDATNGQDSPEVRKALGQLRNLLQNEDFLITMVAALEARTDRFTQQERNHFGSLVSAFLFTDPAYFTRILTALICGLIARKKEAQDNYKVTFRRCDSVAERLLPIWLAFHMYDHLASRVAEPLFRLHREMRLQIYRGPVDQVTEDSRYTINEQKLLKKEIPFKALTLNFHDRLRIFSGDDQLQCKVTALDCDTVHQAKEKILDAVYSRLEVPASQRTHADQYDLVRVPNVATPQGNQGRPPTDGLQVLPEFDDSDTSDVADGLQRLRRLSCLNLAAGGGDTSGPFWVYLRPRKTASSSIESTRRGLSKGASYADIGSLPSGVSSKSLQDMKHFSNSYSRITGVGSSRQYHLVQPGNAGHHTIDRGANKKRRARDKSAKQLEAAAGDNQQIVSEVLYPILLSTKKNLVGKITELFGALFPTLESQQESLLTGDNQEQENMQQQQLVGPPANLQCVAYLFALIDELARDKSDRSTDVAHVWKSNALMLRFYTHHLLNVEYLLDVDVPGPVRYCMSTVSTLFMDACSAERPKKPDKTSTAQKLLFYSEMAELHAKVEAFYASLRAPLGSADDFMLPNCQPFNSGPLLKELFTCFVFKYYEDIVRHLQQHQPCVSDSLISSLQSVMLQLGSESPLQQQQQQQQTQHQHGYSSTRDRKKRSNSRPALDTNAYEF